MMSIPNAAPIEFVTGIDWRDEVIDEPLKVVDGRLVVPDRPGIGVELDPDGVDKHRWNAGDPH
jgi:galactonate dehydratase